MFKKLLKGFGIALLILICLFVLIAVWSGYKSSEYEKTVIPYMNTAIADISSWELDTFKNYLTPSEIENINGDDLKRLIKALSKMGALVEIGEYQFNTVTSRALTSVCSGTFVTYTVPALSENVDAVLTIPLKEEE